MRKAFESQQRLDCCPVLNVQLNVNCRDEIIPILRALQHIYSQGKLRDSILRTIAKDVNGSSDPKRGRKGLYYWEILVLAAVRLGCELDYDALQDLAENHRTLRHIMGIGDWDEDTSSCLLTRPLHDMTCSRAWTARRRRRWVPGNETARASSCWHNAERAAVRCGDD
jgi:IS5 family transposase